MRLRLKTVVACAARVVVGSIFVISGFEKATKPPEEFAALIDTYHLMPQEWTKPVGVVMAWSQLFLGVGLTVGFYIRKMVVGVGILLGLFIGVLFSVIIRGLSISDCGCFGSMVHLKPWQTLSVDIFLLLTLVFVWKDGGRLWSLDEWIEPRQ